MSIWWLFPVAFVVLIFTIYGLLSLIDDDYNDDDDDDDDDDDYFNYAARKRNNDTAVFISTLGICT